MNSVLIQCINTVYLSIQIYNNKQSLVKCNNPIMILRAVVVSTEYCIIQYAKN